MAENTGNVSIVDFVLCKVGQSKKIDVGLAQSVKVDVG